MPVTNGYCSVPELRNQFSDGGFSLNDALLERAINTASRAIDKFCGRRFWLDAEATTRTYLPLSPLVVLTDDIGARDDVVVAVGTDGATFPTEWAATDFILEPRNADVAAAADTADAYSFWRIETLGGRAFPCNGRPTVSVTARFGWSAVPDGVAEACILKAASLFKRKDATYGVLGFNEFGGVVRIGRNDPDVAALLAPFIHLAA